MSTPFYDLASLVVVPSGYKSGKVYAQKPLTTDGQLAFTRASTATRVNASGLIEAVASGVPRLDYLGSTCPRLLLEPQRSNLILQSESINSATWTKDGGFVTANATASPDGYSNADLFTEDTSTGNHRVYQSPISTSVNQPLSFSVFAKYNGRQYIYLRTDDSSNIKTAVFDIQNGTAGAVTSGATSKIESYGSVWYRCTISVAATANAFVCEGLVGFLNGTTFGSASYTGNGTSGAYLWGFQGEVNAAYASSYIPTTTAAVTRVADAASKTGISSLIGQTEGVIFIDFVAGAQNADGAGFSLITAFGNSTENFQLYAIGTALYWYAWKTNVLIDQTATQTLVAGDRYKVAYAYKSGDWALYINGVQKRTNTEAAIPVTSQFNLSASGLGVAAVTAKNEYNQVLLFKTRLTNAQLAELTA